MAHRRSEKPFFCFLNFATSILTPNRCVGKGNVTFFWYGSTVVGIGEQLKRGGGKGILFLAYYESCRALVCAEQIHTCRAETDKALLVGEIQELSSLEEGTASCHS